jgi:hypothetical protein
MDTNCTNLHESGVLVETKIGAMHERTEATS